MIIIKALILAHVFVFMCDAFETRKQRIREAMLDESSSATLYDLRSPNQTECQPIVLELLHEELTAETVKPIVKFISKEDDDFLYSGYLEVYKLIKQKELGNAALFQLAYQVKEDELRGNCLGLISQFPSAVKAIISSGPVCIKNRGFGEYLFAGKSEYNHDEERRNVFTWVQSAVIGRQGEWTFKHLEGNKFHIKSAMYDEYMYSPANDLQYDKDRRRVFTWLPKWNGSPEGEWAIEVEGEDVFIRNVHRNEYLYTLDGVFPHAHIRSVATWVPKGRTECDSGDKFQCRWRLSNC